jgi:hypothetical protein
MKNPKRFYTYAYLREDRTPYYIGKGEKNRIYKKKKNEIQPPKDKSRIIFLKENLTEKEAFEHEIYMIAVFGRKDLGTGILHNRTNGGEGCSGAVRSEEWKLNQSKNREGILLSEEHKRKIGESKMGKPRSEETKRKQSESMKGKYTGEKHPLYGKPKSQESRKKQSKSRKGKYTGKDNSFYGRKHSEEFKKNHSKVNKGKKWWNDGCGNDKLSKECPGEGWILGRSKIKS